MEIALPAHEELLAEFYRDLYLPEFHHQREPLEVWQARLRGERDDGYQLRIFVEVNHGHLEGGAVCELYPESGCGLLTYLVVAPEVRRRGVGGALLQQARQAVGDAALVLGEISDPQKHDDERDWQRLERFQRWGARVLDVTYVQPDLGYGRDPDLLLVAFDPPEIVEGERLRTFFREFYRITERREPPPEMLASVSDSVSWHVLRSDLLP